MFDCDEFLYNLSTADDYLDIYDYIAVINDIDLYNDIYDIVANCESNDESVDTVYLVIENKLIGDSNEEGTEELVKSKTVDDYVKDIADAGNDKDLENILNEIDENGILDNKIEDMRQIFKNNRYSNLDDKKSRILQILDVKTESANKLTEDINGDSIKENDVDNSEEDNVEDIKTTLDYLQDRIGQKMSLGEFNTTLQSLFGRYNEVFILFNDIYNMDKDEPQELVVSDDDDLYTITYNIVDIMNGTIEITDVTVE